MPAKETTASSQVFDPTQLIKFGQKQVDAFIEMQREFCNSVEQANRNWATRAELERDVTVECATKLLAAKTFPEAATAYEEWMSRRMTALADDSRKLFADGEKLTASASKLLWNNGFGLNT